MLVWVFDGHIISETIRVLAPVTVSTSEFTQHTNSCIPMMCIFTACSLVVCLLGYEEWQCRRWSLDKRVDQTLYVQRLEDYNSEHYFYFQINVMYDKITDCGFL